MEFVLQQKVFSLHESFTVKDIDGNALYEVKGKLLSWGHKLTVKDLDGQEVMHVNEKVLSFPTKYTLETADGQEAALHAHITLLRAHYTLETPNGDWDIHGDFVDHNYEMRCGDTTIATVHQKILSWGDCYEISVPNDSDAMLALGVVLADFEVTLFGIRANASIFFLNLLGLPNALIYAGVWPLAIRGLGRYTKLGSSLLIMGLCGNAILPLLYGFVAQHWGMRTGYWVLIPCFLYLLFFALKGYRIEHWPWQRAKYRA